MYDLIQSTKFITYREDETIYHEIDKTFKLPKNLTNISYYQICIINGYAIKCEKYGWGKYSVWRNRVCFEDRIESFAIAKKIAKNM